MHMDRHPSVLVIAAHPDDEVLGCGGTIAKMAQQGAKVSCFFLGKGKASRGVKGQELAKEQVELKKEAEAASRILAISRLYWEDFPDQKFDTVPFLEIVQAIEGVKQQVKPDAVFTHHAADINLDHKLAFRAVMTAFRPLPGDRTKEIYSFVDPASVEWAGEDAFLPNAVVDITETIEKKRKAMEAYQSELREYPHPRSLRGLEVQAQYWGSVFGKEYAEPFFLVRAAK